MTLPASTSRDMRVPRASLTVRGQVTVWDTGPESTVPSAASAVGGAGLRRAGADGGEELA